MKQTSGYEVPSQGLNSSGIFFVAACKSLIKECIRSVLQVRGICVACMLSDQRQ